MVSATQAIHRLTFAMDMARPRTRVGKISDITTHTPGPRPTAKAPSRANIMESTSIAGGGWIRNAAPSAN